MSENVFGYKFLNHSDKEPLVLFIGKSANHYQALELFHKNYKDDIFEVHDIKESFDFIINNPVQLCLISIDEFESEDISKIFEIINYGQVPTILMTNESQELLLPIEHPYCVNYQNNKDELDKKICELEHREHINLNLSKRKRETKTKDRSPILFVVCTILLIEPLLKLFLISNSTQTTLLETFMIVVNQNSFLFGVEFWLVFPLVALALFLERSWSLVIIGTVQIYCIFCAIYYPTLNWPQIMHTPHFSSHFQILINSSLILFIAIPSLRRSYWNRAHKLWRDTSRFASNIPTFIRTSINDKRYTTISNISRSGAYFEVDESLKVGSKTSLELVLNGEVNSFDATIKRTADTEFENIYGYGVEFNNLTEEQKETLKAYISNLTNKIQ